MIRQLIAIVVLLTLTTNALALGHEMHESLAHGTFSQGLDECQTKQEHQPVEHHEGEHNDDSHGCCVSHQHYPTALLLAIADFALAVSVDSFTPTVPHFSPSDHLQERFIPPRHTA